MTKIKAMTAKEAKTTLTLQEFTLPNMQDDEVEVDVISCGLCHSDLSMLDDDWGITSYPFVPGHEIIGKITKIGAKVPNHKIGDIVGIGWFAGSCMHCHSCLQGDHNLCDTPEQTIVNRYGGFADKVRSKWMWAIKIPEGMDHNTTGPFLCGGITVFNPLIQFGIKPTDKVGVIGLGGLGHFAVQFLNKWGCEVYLFTSNLRKKDDALKMGAHHVICHDDEAEMAKIKGKLNFIISTTNIKLPWMNYIDLLAPKGRFHSVGVVLDGFDFNVFPFIMGQKSFSGSPLGSPENTSTMLNFASRHKIKPITEVFKMSEVNQALEKMRKGDVHYRIILINDL